jgi:integral membrane protein (TIGR01906 family)
MSRRFFSSLSVIIGTLCLILSITFIGINFTVYFKPFYNSEFKKNDTLEYVDISQGDLNRVRDSLINYMSGKIESLQVKVTDTYTNTEINFYTDDELEHMESVSVVFSGFRIASIFLLIIGVSLILFTLVFKLGKTTLLKVVKTSSITSLIFLISFATFAVILITNYDQAEIIFHEIFFPQGNWMFDMSSLMINMLPQELFFDAAVIIISTGLGGSVLICLSYFPVKVLSLRKTETI